MDFIYERFWLPVGVKIEEITGGGRYSGKVWREIAMQIYCENGKNGYREVGHFHNGAPFLYNSDERISISHTEGMLAVATIKAEAGFNPSVFSPDNALGLDVERADRKKAMEVRGRFLTEAEQAIVSPDDVESNVIAWTCKEAMLKAGMDPSVDWLHDIVVTALPSPGGKGAGYIVLNGERFELTLYCFKSGDYILTVAK